MNNQLFVIPMDGSPKAAECVDRIGPMLAAGDRAVLLHVRDGKSRSDQGAIAEAERKLASRGIAVSREEPAASDAASGIVDFVRSNRPDMVLMQSMGTGDERTGVAERVLRSSPAPVLSIAKEANVRKTFNSILVPTDTTAFSTAVLEPLIPMAKASGASITLLFVDWDDPTDTPEWRSDRRQQRVNHVAQWLREPRKMIEDAGLKAEIRVEHGDVDETILKVVAEGNHDLVAMATHGRSGAGRWIVGSTAETVRERSSIPVLVHCPVAAKKKAAAASNKSIVSRFFPPVRTSS